MQINELKKAILEERLRIIDIDSERYEYDSNTIVINFTNERVVAGRVINLPWILNSKWDEIRSMILEDSFETIEGFDIKALLEANYTTETENIRAVIENILRNDTNLLTRIYRAFFEYVDTRPFSSNYIDTFDEEIVDDIVRHVLVDTCASHYLKIHDRFKHHVVRVADMYSIYKEYALQEDVFPFSRRMRRYLLQGRVEEAYELLIEFELRRKVKEESELYLFRRRHYYLILEDGDKGFVFHNPQTGNSANKIKLTHDDRRFLEYTEYRFYEDVECIIDSPLFLYVQGAPAGVKINSSSGITIMRMEQL